MRTAEQRDEDAVIIRNMQESGGSFVKALGHAAACADEKNLMKIQIAFGNYWEAYRPASDIPKKSIDGPLTERVLAAMQDAEMALVRLVANEDTRERLECEYKGKESLAQQLNLELLEAELQKMKESNEH